MIRWRMRSTPASPRRASISSSPARCLLWACLSTGLVVHGAIAEGPPTPERHPADAGAVGIVVQDTGPLPGDLRSRSPGVPCSVLIRIGPDALAAPERIDPALDAAAGAGLRIAVGVSLPAWQGATPAEVDAWATRAGVFARHAAGRVAAYQILERAAPDGSARDYAYLLKHAAVAIRAENPRARVVSAGLGAEDAAWLQDLYDQDAAPYLDVLAARDLASLSAVADLRDQLDANAAVWVVGAAIDPATPRSAALRVYVEARAAGADTVLFAPPYPPGLPGFLSELRSLFPPALTPAAPAALPFDPAATTISPAVASAVRVTGFYDPRSRDGVAVYDAPGTAPAGGFETATVRFPLRFPVESADVFDPETGSVVPIGVNVAAGRVIFAPIRSTGLLLRFRRAAAGLPLQEAQIGATSELSAEEIIALERQTSTAQAARLKHYEARASVSIHYTIAAVAQSVDVVSENRLFVHDGKQDYEQTDLFVDGARWRGKKPPYLPFIQPDKVKEVPLTITLDEGYRYTLVKRDRVDGRDCYVIAFEPKTAGLSLYEGRISIDAVLFTRVRMEAVQTGLKDPLRSNQITYHFGPVPGPDGDYWLPQAVDGQMVFEVLGQNLQVEREARYSDFAINKEDFRERLAGAYGSGRPLYRETDEGYYKLDASGREEILKSASTPRNTFLVMGVSVGDTGIPSAPFAGVNFFDFNYRDTGTQVNLAWAGPFVDLSWTNPHVTNPGPDGTPVAFTAQATLIGVPLRDKIAREDETLSGENVDIYREQVQVSVALPTGRFLKWTVQGRTTYMDFARRKDTDPAFIIPVTTVDTGLLLRGEFNRKGYALGAWGESARRSAWEPWGLPGNKFSPDDRDYTRLGFDVRKSLYLGEFRKINLGVSGFDGRSLDRFSRFELGDFRSARVRGFNGSGFHFDRGVVADTSYAFTVRKAMRVDTGVQAGWIQSVDDFGPGYVRVIGAGIALEFSGPWSTLMNVRYGRAVESSLPGRSGGGSDVRFVLFKTFDKWSRKPKP
jgi:hypothetical protein